MGSHLGQPGQFMPQASEDWSILSRVAIASVTSQGTMGGLLVAGFVRIDSLLKSVNEVYYCLLLWILTADENCRLAIDICFWGDLRRLIPIRKAYVDK